MPAHREEGGGTKAEAGRELGLGLQCARGNGEFCTDIKSAAAVNAQVIRERNGLIAEDPEFFFVPAPHPEPF